MTKPVACLLALVPVLAYGHDASQWRYEDQETISRTFSGSGGAALQRLLVDNFSGYIHVTGYDGSEVRMKLRKHIRAESSRALDEAKREVTLDVTQPDNAVRLYQDGPFRRSQNRHGESGYSVTFDFDLEVPRAIELGLKGFNQGDIRVRGTSGDFDVRGFNGGIEMEEIGGAGAVHTFNGPVTVSFTRNPPRKSEFKTFNGSVDLYFQPNLNAQLRVKTFHGGIYSDTGLGTLTLAPSSPEGRNGKLIYRSGGVQVLRAGNGGPELMLDTFNGSIRLHSRK